MRYSEHEPWRQQKSRCLVQPALSSTPSLLVLRNPSVTGVIRMLRPTSTSSHYDRPICTSISMPVALQLLFVSVSFFVAHAARRPLQGLSAPRLARLQVSWSPSVGVQIHPHAARRASRPTDMNDNRCQRWCSVKSNVLSAQDFNRGAQNLVCQLQDPPLFLVSQHCPACLPCPASSVA